MFNIVKNEILSYMPKEYYCHLQFVHRLALEFYAEKGGDREIIEIAAIAHDYGRVEGGDNSQHAEIGADKIYSYLVEHDFPPARAKHVANCTRTHNTTGPFDSLEAEIVANADQLSKVAYHEAFMLMVKKETFQERAAWALKYLDKGFNNATFSDLKEHYRKTFVQKRAAYESVLSPEEHIPSVPAK